MKKTYKFSLALSFFVLMTFNLNALANASTFEVYNEDGRKIGNGVFEKQPYSKAKVTTYYNNIVYSGLGELNKDEKEFVYGMQSNRGQLPNKQLKKTTLTLLANGNSKVSCEIRTIYRKVYGHCVDSGNNKLILNTRSSTNS